MVFQNTYITSMEWNGMVERGKPNVTMYIIFSHRLGLYERKECVDDNHVRKEIAYWVAWTGGVCRKVSWECGDMNSICLSPSRIGRWGSGIWLFGMQVVKFPSQNFLAMAFVTFLPNNIFNYLLGLCCSRRLTLMYLMKIRHERWTIQAQSLTKSTSICEF